MPNQRKKGKVLIGGYVEGALKKDLQRIAKQEKSTVKTVFEGFLIEGLENYKRKHGPI